MSAILPKEGADAIMECRLDPSWARFSAVFGAGERVVSLRGVEGASESLRSPLTARGDSIGWEETISPASILEEARR